MSQFLKTFKKNNSSQFKKYKKYLKETDWSTPIIKRDEEGNITYTQYYFIKDIKDKGEVIYEGKETEFKLQHKIATTVLNRLKYFVKAAEGDIGKNPKADTLVKQMRDILDIHLKRIDDYISSFSVLEDKEAVKEDEGKTQKDYKSEEIEFDALLYKSQNSINDEIKKLNLDRDNEESILKLLDGQKAPLSMRDAIEEHFPDIKKYVEGLGIDFKSKPKNEMLMHIENPPEWNLNKHYFEQDKETLQFYVDEFKKIRDGIIIDGVYISGWMYTHLNIFKTYIPVDIENPHTGEKEVKDVIMSPPLRDNEWFIIQDNYLQAKKEHKMMFLCATRRAAKTTLISSYLQWNALKGGKKLVVAGGSSEDLGHIETDFKITMLNAAAPFYYPNISNDWKKEVKLGLKKTNQRDINPCTLRIINLEGGAEKASEKLAGFTPDCFVLDECMKVPFKSQLDGAMPAFEANGKLRFVPILSGTGGNEELSKDALRVLKDPEAHRIINMNWDALERNVPKKDISWTRRKFGTFLPGQMSIITSDLRIESTLDQYLGIENTKNLSKIKIKLTDWGASLERLKERRKKLTNDKGSLTKEKVYFPIDPEDIFLSGRSNPFPREELTNYRDRLIEEGDVGKKVVLDYDGNGDVQYHHSDKEYPDLPFSGGYHDAPCTIYKDPMPNAGWGHYIAGFDDYKHEASDGDSVGSFVIVDRLTKEIVASYHSRPDPHNELYRQGLLLLELYNAEVFMENADMGFKYFLDTLELTDKYIVKSFDTTGDFSLQASSNRKYGWSPTGPNKRNLFNYFLSVMREQDRVEDETGRPRIRWGFEKTKDLRLIEEMINYKEGGNFDVITSAMSAYFYDYYLTAEYGAPKPPMTEQEKQRLKKRRLETQQKMRRKRSLFPQSRLSTFPAGKSRHF